METQILNNMKNISNIYEINTRVWLKRFRNEDENINLSEVPDEYWIQLKESGIDCVWLMGVWKLFPESAQKYCFEQGLVDEYTSALPNWTKYDVTGSPYAIDNYTLDPSLGDKNDLKKLNPLC